MLSGIASFLALLMLIPLVVGLINPKLLKRDFFNSRKKVALVFGLLFFAFGTISGATASPQSNTQKKSETKAVAANDKVTSVPTATKAPTATPKPMTMEEKLAAAYKGNKDGTKFMYDAENKTASIELTSDSFWDEQGAVNGVFNMLVSFGKEAFKINGVDKVIAASKTTFTDSYGKKSIDDVARIGMTKEEFSKYDWDNLRYQPIYAQVQRSASPFYIHPALLRKIDLEKIKLTN